MHQDWAWGWQHLAPADDMLSVSFQIDAAANGCIELFAGYHDTLMKTPGEERGFYDDEMDRLIDSARGEKMETQPGDVLIFHSLAPHQSGKNLAEYSRRALYLTYNAARSGKLREEYYRHYMEEMAGRGDAKEAVFV
jgi:ectoine hydroxylase-related dioxygenase (phytanoyl-CoA dioxygenase family)